MLIENKFIYKVAAIRELESQAIEKYQISVLALMQRAGNAAFRILRQKWQGLKNLCVICGKGNNGGDGYVLALSAHCAGMQVKVLYLYPPEKLSGAAFSAAAACKGANVPLYPYSVEKIGSAEVIVDAILGVGLVGEVSPLFQQVIREINAKNLPILAIDVPSGLDADNGKVLGAAIKSNLTVTFLGNKIGLFLNCGPDYAGEVVIDNLEIPKEIYQKVVPEALVMNFDELKRLLKPRPRNASKIDFGFVLVIGGNYGMAGAVRMVGEAALRVGAGMVNVITRRLNVSTVTSNRPELMCRGFAWWNNIKPLLKRSTVVVIGPGLGKTCWSRILFNRAVKKVIKLGKPIVLDADGLNLLSEKNLYYDRWILTPHVGEAARLLKTTSAKVQEDMLGTIKAIQKKYGGVCILKSARTLVLGHDSILKICVYGNPGMSTAGMGDILSGVLGGLLAQGLSLIDAAMLGSIMHALAGDFAAKEAGERGLVATDIIPYLRQLVNCA